MERQNEARQDRIRPPVPSDVVSYGSASGPLVQSEIPDRAYLERMRDEEVKRQREYASRDLRRWAVEMVMRFSPNATSTAIITAAKELVAFIEGA